MRPEVPLIFTCVTCLVIHLCKMSFFFFVKKLSKLVISPKNIMLFLAGSCQYFTATLNDKLNQRGVGVRSGVMDAETSPLHIFTKAELSLLTGRSRTKFNAALNEDDSEFLERKDGSGEIIILGRNVSKAIDKDNIEWMLLRTLQKLMASRHPSSFKWRTAITCNILV